MAEPTSDSPNVDAGGDHQRPRLVEIIRNLSERITEARMNGWLGEVQALDTSLDAARRKLVSLDRSMRRTQDSHPTDLGIPAIRSIPARPC